MNSSQFIKNFLLPLLFFLVLAGAIALFFVREQLMPNTVGHELSIGPTSSSPKIVTDQFLILIHPSHVDKLDDILRPLGLEVKYPLLNWIVVGMKEGEHTIALLGSDKASAAHLIVSSLLNHPLILDAHHNFVMEPTTQNVWPYDHEWHFLSAHEDHPYSLALKDTWQLSQGSSNVHVAVIDEFSEHDQFNFPRVFPACASRVTFFSPLGRRQIEPLPGQSPHGEPLLMALGACNGVAPFSSGMDSAASIIAVEPPSNDHASVFLTALLASGKDVCAESIIPCPRNFHPALAETAPDVMLIPMSSSAPELLQISADIMDALRARGTIVVTSAGNDQANANNFFPGGAPQVINVGALTKEGKRAHFSNWGSAIDVLAPGDRIELVYPNGIKTISGTSIAAAFVAGTLSLMKTRNANLQLEQARHIISQAGTNMPCDNYCNGLSRCQEICCDKRQNQCNLATLNPVRCLQNSTQNLSSPLLKLDKTYALYLRDAQLPTELVVMNSGDMVTDVHLTTFDEKISFAPKEFSLTPGASQSIKIWFEREPFTQQIYKFEFTARINGQIRHQIDAYVEYVPKH